MREVYRGVFPIAPTPFAETGDIDWPGQKRVLDCMIDKGSTVSAFLPITPNNLRLPTKSATIFSSCALSMWGAGCR